MEGFLDRSSPRSSFIKASSVGLMLLLASAHAFAAGYYLEQFDDGLAQDWTFGAGWTVSGAPDTGLYLAGTSTTRVHALYGSNTWDTGFAYTVRLRSPTWSTSNPIGLVFNRQNASNYYEALVNSQGAVTLHRVLNGSRTTIASGSALLRPDRYTDIQVVRIGARATVRLNGTNALVHDLTPAEVFEGQIGVVVSNNTGHFDYAVVTNATTPLGPNFPRIGTVRIGSPHDYDDPDVQEEIARAHVALLHYTTFWQSTHPPMENIAQSIKALSGSKNTKIILYTKANEANLENESEKTELEVHAKIQEMNWWVRDSRGVHVGANYKPDIFKLVNLTRHAPADPATGLRWQRWFAKWTHENYYLPNPSIDGLYMDNVNWRPPESATSTSDPPATADWNRDGVSDPGTRADVGQWFRQGFRHYFDEIGGRMPGSKFRFANLARWGQTTVADNAELAEYYGAAHGGPLEGLLVKGSSSSPEEWGGWARMMETYRKTMSVLIGQKIGMFMHGIVPPTDPLHYRDMRYGLGSCLLDDGYYSPYIQGTGPGTGFTTTPEFDEYGVNLGQATTLPPTAAWQNGVWRRDFANGIVLVNPKGNGARTVTLETTFTRIDGTQDPSVNNGNPVTTLTLQDRDGIILLE